MVLFVKPRENYKIIDPDLGDVLPVDGRLVPDSPYWQHRIRDADVTSDPKAAEAAAAANEKAAIDQAAEAAAATKKTKS